MNETYQRDYLSGLAARFHDIVAATPPGCATPRDLERMEYLATEMAARVKLVDESPSPGRYRMALRRAAHCVAVLGVTRLPEEINRAATAVLAQIVTGVAGLVLADLDRRSRAFRLN